MEERHPPVIAPIYLGSVPPLLAPESLITTRTISKYNAEKYQKYQQTCHRNARVLMCAPVEFGGFFKEIELN
jgi:hypothetical protein